MKEYKRSKLPITQITLAKIDWPIPLREQDSLIEKSQDFDSLSYMYWLSEFAKPENFVGMPDSAKMLNIKQGLKIEYIPIELASPYYWKNYALVSLKISDQYTYILYCKMFGTWKRKSYIVDAQ